MLVERAGELNFADDLLKRWLLAANEKNTKEKIDEDFLAILPGFEISVDQGELG